MTPSQRIQTITPSGDNGWELFLKARDMIAKGVPVIELTIGEHDIRTDRSILDHMHASALGGHTGYTAVPGIPKLRQAIAARVQAKTGVSTTMHNVLITPGGQMALYLAHMAACEVGDTALFIDPYYATYPGTIRAAGAVAQSIQTHAANDFQPQKSDLEAAARTARSLLINTPNNPTGSTYSPETMNMIAQICQDQNLWLISDEVYDTQIWEGTHISPRALPEMQNRTIVIGSMSKSHAMTGSRIGWIIAPEDTIDHLTNLATHMTYGVQGYIQDAALFALNQGSEFETEIAAPFKRRRDIAQKIIAQHPQLKAISPKGAMYLMLDIRATGLSGKEFGHKLLDEKQIAVMPGESFGSSAAGHIRIAMTIKDEAFAQAIKTLCQFASELCHG